MQRRATSKKRAAETEKEIEMDMENKEATPVEVGEKLLPPVSVSYTHLDVYKRQTLYSCVNKIWLTVKFDLNPPGEYMQQRATSVSYTHLDVYKRQVLVWVL